MHILSHAHLTPYFILLFVPIFILTILIYIFSCVMFHCFIAFYVIFIFYFYFIFALSIEQTCPDLHFTTDYTLYDCVCDK